MTRPLFLSRVSGYVFFLVFFVFANGVSYAQPPEGSPHSINITVENRKVTGEKNIRLTQGDKVDLIWTTDEPLTIHLHGYDLEASLKPEEKSIMRLDAHATGRFPVTVHGNHAAQSSHSHSHGGTEITLIYLEIYPE